MTDLSQGGKVKVLVTSYAKIFPLLRNTSEYYINTTIHCALKKKMRVPAAGNFYRNHYCDSLDHVFISFSRATHDGGPTQPGDLTCGVHGQPRHRFLPCTLLSLSTDILYTTRTNYEAVCVHGLRTTRRRYQGGAGRHVVVTQEGRHDVVAKEAEDDTRERENDTLSLPRRSGHVVVTREAEDDTLSFSRLARARPRASPYNNSTK